MSTHTRFAGSIPELYERFIVPLIMAPYARDLAKRVHARPGDRVLELACGTGALTREVVLQLPPTATLTATDLNEPMLAAARKTTESAHVHWQTANLLALPFDAASFDIVVCEFGIMFLPDKAAAAREVRRVLRPGGAYLFNVWGSLEYNPLPRLADEVVSRLYPENPPAFYGAVPHGYFDPQQIERDLRAGGFSHVDIDTVDLEATITTPEEAAVALIEGTPFANTIRDRGTVPVEAIRTALASAIERGLGGPGTRVPMRALVVQAT